jgi:FimV-like protein
MKKALLAGSFILLAVFTLYSADFTVAYVEGDAEYKTKNSWELLDIGNKLTDADTVRLIEDGVIELKSASGNITITRKGTYILANMLKSSKEMNSLGFGSMVAGKLQTLVVTSGEGQTAVMGVRGAVDIEEIEWAEDKNGDTIKDGEALIAAGSYREAMALFTAKLSDADDYEKDELNFYIGYAASAVGEDGQALKNLDCIRKPEGKYYYSSFVILKSALLNQVFAYEEAVKWINQQEKSLAASALTAAEKELLKFLKAAAYKNMGDKKEARKLLQELVKTSGDEETRQKADAMLKTL